jgi:AcrR family transcriptional regulator
MSDGGRKNINDSIKESIKNSIKERILEVARTMFNEHGVEAVTVRHLAEELGMSHGNLCYHFPRKEDIIFTLYNRIVEGMSAQVALWNPDKITLSMVLGALHASYELQYHYKFLMIDFVNIMRRIPEIRTHFQAIFSLRKQQFSLVLGLLQEAKLIKSDIPSEQREYLILQNYLMGDFWMSESEILYTGKEADKCRFYARIGTSLLYPYLTAKGQREYTEFYENLDNTAKKAQKITTQKTATIKERTSR